MASGRGSTRERPVCEASSFHSVRLGLAFSPSTYGLGFGVEGLGFRIQGLGFEDEGVGLGFRVEG